MYVTMVSMPELLPESFKPFKAKLQIPKQVANQLGDFEEHRVRRLLMPFSIPKVGESIMFHPALILPGRHQTELSMDTQMHIHAHSVPRSEPTDWRIIANFDPITPLLFRYLDAMCEIDNEFAFSEAPGGLYIESAPAVIPEQIRLEPFDGATAYGVAFRAGEVAHSGCAAEILGNRAVVFAQTAYLPEDVYRTGQAFMAAETAFEARSQTALPEQS